MEGTALIKQKKPMFRGDNSFSASFECVWMQVDP